jgi:hypothetical protein
MYRSQGSRKLEPWAELANACGVFSLNKYWLVRTLPFLNETKEYEL